MYDDGLPILLGYQTDWNAERAPIAFCEKARRIGLSWGDAGEEVPYASGGSGNVFYMSYNKDMTETFIDDCAWWARMLNRACSEVIEETVIVEEKEILRFRIRFPAGKSITALPSNPWVVRSKGRPGDKLLIDEAAFCADLEELLDAAVAFTQWGGLVRVVSTHNGDDNEFNDYITDIRAGKLPYALHRITLDDAIAAGLARRVCTVKKDVWHPGYAAEWRGRLFAQYRDSAAADQELLCIPRYGGGAWLSRQLIESRMIDGPLLQFFGDARYNGLPEPVRRDEMRDWLDAVVAPALRQLNPLRRHVIGGDFARSGDMSSYAPTEIGETLVRTIPFIFEMHNVPHQQQVQAVSYVCDRLPRFSGGAFDARGNGSFLAEEMVDRYGAMCEPIMATEAWYREHMPPLKAAFEDGAIAVPKHADVLDDLRAFKVIRGVPKLPDQKTGKSGQRHGDAGVAIANAWYASCNCGHEFGYTPAGRPGDHDPQRPRLPRGYRDPDRDRVGDPMGGRASFGRGAW